VGKIPFLVVALSVVFLAACHSVNRSTPVASNHSLSGVVKSVDSTRIILTRTGKTPGDVTFVLSPTTQREGPIGVGAIVQVRFHAEGHTQVATAILATPPKPHAMEEAR
jgi:hypothetical protein